MEEDQEKPMLAQDSKTKGETDKMAQELIDGALNSKSIINFNGGDLNVDSSDLNKDNDVIAKENKKAIHEALNEVETDLGIKKPADTKKEAAKTAPPAPAQPATPAPA
jgi:hypothetical protein